MLKTFHTIFALLLVFGFSIALISDGSETFQYFPDTLGSYWVYVDQNGNEVTRRAVKSEEIAKKIHRVFDYEPALENWVDYDYHIHANLYQVGEKQVTFWVGDEAQRAVQARLAKEMEALRKMLKEMAPPQAEIDFNVLHKIEVEAQDHFYMLPASTTDNEKWDVAEIKAKVTITLDPPQGDPQEVVLEFTIIEKGDILGTESIETLAGTFEDCLKIEYRTHTGVARFGDAAGDGELKPPGESVTTLWLAPNVGIVKFHQEAADILLKTIPMPGIVASTTVKTFELKKYEIKSADSESGGSD